MTKLTVRFFFYSSAVLHCNLIFFCLHGDGRQWWWIRSQEKGQIQTWAKWLWSFKRERRQTQRWLEWQVRRRDVANLRLPSQMNMIQLNHAATSSPKKLKCRNVIVPLWCSHTYCEWFKVNICYIWEFLLYFNDFSCFLKSISQGVGQGQGTAQSWWVPGLWQRS